MSFNKIFVAGFFVVLLCIGCRQIDVFEKNTVIPNMKWQSNFSCNGNFNIEDSISSYNIYVVLRHTDKYPYNNIWLNVGLQTPGTDSMLYQKINLLLGDDANGWQGVGLNDIWEVRKLISNTPVRFKNKGNYQFTLQQLMRDNPLPYVMSAGLRLEKTK